MTYRLVSFAVLAACASRHAPPAPSSSAARATPGTALATPASSARAPVADSPFGVRITGHGPPVILIPGLASSADVWDTTVAHLAPRFTCHVLELPGFAGRPAIAAPVLSTVRDALAGYIRAHHLDRPVIVGHSLGGFLALDLARSAPELAGRLVIVDAYPFLSAVFDPNITVDAAREIAEGWRRRLARQSAAEYERQNRGTLARMITDPAQQEVALGWGARSDRAAVAQAMAELMSTDLRPALFAITAPTLVIAAGQGHDTDRDALTRLFAAQYAGLRGARLAIADRARHFVMLDDPAFLFSELDTFLR